MTPLVVDHHRRQQQQGEQTMQSAYLPTSDPRISSYQQQHEESAAMDTPPPAPLVAPNDPSLVMEVVSAVPKFPQPKITDADRISTLVYSPAHQKTAVVKNILIPRPHYSTQRNDVLRGAGNRQFSSSTGQDPDEMDIDTSGNSKEETSAEAQQQTQRAYWLQRTLRSAIYGKVRYGVVLRRRPRGAASSEAEWEVTEEACAVKEMVWDKIRQYHGRHAEDPMNEVGALQYLMEFKREQQKQARDDHLLVPLDILSDEANLYIVSPYCSGGELFDILDETDKFSEREARYWMKQILLGLYNLQKAGICHRDLSLENLLVHDRKTLVIDLGMCLRIPYEDDDKYDPPDRDASDVNICGAHDLAQDERDESRGPTPSPPRRSRRPCIGGRHNRRRLLLPPQGLCGKWHYMSPEILADRDPFDGFAVDLWAAGVILFLMVTGFPPWERADDSDERFRYLTQGYMKQLLTQWELGLSGDLMDLLQKLLYKDPMMRLTLRQVMEHPWLQPSSGRGTRRNSPRSPAA